MKENGLIAFFSNPCLDIGVHFIIHLRSEVFA